MKHIISTVCLLALALFSFQTVQAQNAKEILQKVSSKYGSNSAIKGSFSLKYYDAKGSLVTSQNGTFALKGIKYKVSIPGQDIITDGKSAWTYRKNDKEVQIDAYNPNATMTPAKLFSGSYEKEYNYKYAGSQTVSGKSAYLIELTPKTPQKAFTKVYMYVEKSTNAVLGGKVYEKSGAKVDYTLHNVNHNASLSDSYFTFNTKKYPGVDVIDLR